MNKFLKYCLIGIVGIFAFAVIRNVTDNGIAKHCIQHETIGQFASMSNSCDVPIVAKVCGQFIFGSRTCETSQFGPGQRLTTSGSENASILVALLSTNPVVFACKTGFTPVELPGNSYRCDRN